MNHAHRSVHPIPQTRTGYPFNDQLGMTIRQHYAGLAMQALVSRTHYKRTLNAEEIAQKAFQIADAMAEAE